MIQKGTITYFNSDRGFGFVRREAGEGDQGRALFFHIRSVIDRREPDVGATIEFEEGVDERSGRPCALEVRLVSG